MSEEGAGAQAETGFSAMEEAKRMGEQDGDSETQVGGWLCMCGAVVS